MDLTYFQTFREVAYYRSFTKAAAELGYAQSSVTMQIQKLEQFYGVKLFERYGRGLKLTSAGEELLTLTLPMLQLFQQSKESLTSQEGGTLSLGTIDSLASYYLPPIIQQMRQQHPSLTIRLEPERESTIIENVKEGEYDLGLLLEKVPSDLSLDWIRIREEPLVLLTGLDHPLLTQEAITLEHLHHTEWIMTEDSCHYRMLLEKLLRNHHIPYRIGLELGNPEAIKRCLKAGTGVSILPRMAALDEIGRGELAVLPFEHPDLRLDLYMLIHPKKWISRSLQRLIELMRADGNDS